MNAIDTAVFLWINGDPHASAAMVAFATFMSQRAPAVAGVGLLVAAVIGGRPARGAVLRAVLAMSLAWITVSVIRRGFPMPRPASLNLGWQLLQHRGNSGFPSHHAAGALACWHALAFSPWLRGRRALVAVGLVIALAIAWSRIYLGVHFPKDVLVGGAIGCIASAVVGRAVTYLGMRLRRRRADAAAVAAAATAVAVETGGP